MINTERGLRLGYQKFKVSVIIINCKCSQSQRLCSSATSGITPEGFLSWLVLSSDS